MPWCVECDRYLAPPTVRADGTCPTCGRAVDANDRPPPSAVPWHFKLLVAALVIYLGYRGAQGVAWLLHHLH